jgi:hypothetical protein
MGDFNFPHSQTQTQTQPQLVLIAHCHWPLGPSNTHLPPSVLCVVVAVAVAVAITVAFVIELHVHMHISYIYRPSHIPITITKAKSKGSKTHRDRSPARSTWSVTLRHVLCTMRFAYAQPYWPYLQSHFKFRLRNMQRDFDMDVHFMCM